VIDLKEEYSSKLLILSEKNESLRSKLHKENSKLQSKLDSLTVQIGHMESKELRLYSQLEEAKQLQQSESKEHESRTRDLEELIFKKEGSIADLEREIRTKDKTLMERQEQISVLIATLEGESTKDELR
jgi:DNA repair exonuclease SbcCD ATPase subunit